MTVLLAVRFVMEVPTDHAARAVRINRSGKRALVDVAEIERSTQRRGVGRAMSPEAGAVLKRDARQLSERDRQPYG